MTDDATRSRAADCPRCGKPNEGRHPITDDKPDICGLVIGGRVCMLPASGNATPDRAAEQTIEKLRNALLDLCDLHHRTLTGSAKHNPARVSSIHECECLSCRRVSAVLRETEQK